MTILLYVFIFIFFVYFNYYGAIGRIERKKPNLGPVSKKEQEAFEDGTHKKLAMKQSFLGALAYTLIAYLIISLL